MQSINVPLVWFGPIWAIANLCVSFGSLLSHRIQYHLGARGTPMLLLALIAIGYTGLAFNQLIWGFAFYFLLTIMRGIQGPFLHHALQKQSERHERASILSLKSLTFRLGFVITAPLVGMMADRSGLSFCFTILLITQVLLVAILIWPFIKNTKTVWNI
jgi:predicted MFS family arabinose efflux permease